MTSSYAVIDIGSNSVRMVIFDLSHTLPLKLFNEKIFCGLGSDLDKTGKLNPDAIKTALKTIQAFVLLAEAMKISKLSAIATAAVREAKDGKSFLKKVNDVTGIRIRVISGDEEAHYAAMGVLSLDPKAKGAVGDFGGGSLELATLNPKGVLETMSFPLGAFRLLHAKTKAPLIIKDSLKTLPMSFYNQPNFYLIGGSWRALVQTYLSHSGKKSIRLQGCRVSTKKMIEFCQFILKLPTQKIVKTYALDARRASLLPISALALMTVLQTLKPRYIVVSTAGVRDGVIVEYLTA